MAREPAQHLLVPLARTRRGAAAAGSWSPSTAGSRCARARRRPSCVRARRRPARRASARRGCRRSSATVVDACAPARRRSRRRRAARAARSSGRARCAACAPRSASGRRSAAASGSCTDAAGRGRRRRSSAGWLGQQALRGPLGGADVSRRRALPEAATPSTSAVAAPAQANVQRGAEPQLARMGSSMRSLREPGEQDREHEHREGRGGVHRATGRVGREHEQRPVPQVDRVGDVAEEAAAGRSADAAPRPRSRRARRRRAARRRCRGTAWRRCRAPPASAIAASPSHASDGRAAAAVAGARASRPPAANSQARVVVTKYAAAGSVAVGRSSRRGSPARPRAITATSAARRRRGAGTAPSTSGHTR